MEIDLFQKQLNQGPNMLEGKNHEMYMVDGWRPFTSAVSSSADCIWYFMYSEHTLWMNAIAIWMEIDLFLKELDQGPTMLEGKNCVSSIINPLYFISLRGDVFFRSDITI